MLKLLQFRRPRLALVAAVLLVFVACVTLYDASHVDKFGYLVASGLGIYLITVAGKSIRNAYGNLAVWLATCGLGMLLLGIFFTEGLVFSSNSLEDLVPPLIGAVGGLFTGVEEES